MISSYEESAVVVLTSVERCTLVAEQLMDDHIVRPQFTTIAQYQVVTLDCESGWTYRNAETSRTLTCSGSDTWNRTLEACEGINYVYTLYKRFYSCICLKV